MEALLTTVPLQHRILRQLIFEDMGSRWSQILDADPHTCRWILEDDPDASEESESDSDSSHGLKSRVSSDVHSDSGSATSSSEYSSNSEWEVELIHREDTRNSFISWLTSGQDVLHISGNAGSGKSTRTYCYILYSVLFLMSRRPTHLPKTPMASFHTV